MRAAVPVADCRQRAARAVLVPGRARVTEQAQAQATELVPAR
jgi:hypothetical protein